MVTFTEKICIGKLHFFCAVLLKPFCNRILKLLFPDTFKQLYCKLSNFQIHSKVLAVIFIKR